MSINKHRQCCLEKKKRVFLVKTPTWSSKKTRKNCWDMWFNFSLCNENGHWNKIEKKWHETNLTYFVTTSFQKTNAVFADCHIYWQPSYVEHRLLNLSKISRQILRIYSFLYCLYTLSFKRKNWKVRVKNKKEMIYIYFFYRNKCFELYHEYIE